MLRYPLEVRYSDYDTKAHVNNAVYLVYFEWARMKAWTDHMARTLPPGDPALADPPIIVAESRVRYVSPANIGVPLAIEIGVKEIRTRGFSFTYRIVDARDERLIAEGETVQVAFDYGAKRPMPIPDYMRKALETL